jgi:NADH:ubiquinone oxidoreductase subunit D
MLITVALRGCLLWILVCVLLISCVELRMLEAVSRLHTCDASRRARLTRTCSEIVRVVVHAYIASARG